MPKGYRLPISRGVASESGLWQREGYQGGADRVGKGGGREFSHVLKGKKQRQSISSGGVAQLSLSITME